jgi:hypothetical protein
VSVTFCYFPIVAAAAIWSLEPEKSFFLRSAARVCCDCSGLLLDLEWFFVVVRRPVVAFHSLLPLRCAGLWQQAERPLVAYAPPPSSSSSPDFSQLRTSTKTTCTKADRLWENVETEGKGKERKRDRRERKKSRVKGT